MSIEDWANGIDLQPIEDFKDLASQWEAAIRCLLVAVRRGHEESGICPVCWEHSCSEDCEARSLFEVTCDLSEADTDALGFDEDYDLEDDEP